MKSYTDLEQSKKLAEILSLESADMHYARIKDAFESFDWDPLLSPIPKLCAIYVENIPCWSLAALLDVLESEIDGEGGETYQLNIEKDGTWWNVWYRELYDEANPIEIESTEELIDACYEMIIKLNKRGLL